MKENDNFQQNNMDKDVCNMLDKNSIFIQFFHPHFEHLSCSIFKNLSFFQQIEATSTNK